MRTTLLTLSLLAAFLQPAQSTWAAGPAAEDRNRIVAVVNDEVITQVELNRALLPAYLQMQATLNPEELSQATEDLRRKILEQIVNERLMLQMARHPQPVEVAKGKIGTPPVIEVSDEEVEELTAEARSRFQSPEEFAEALSQQGMTEEDLKARLRDQLTIRKLIGREVRSRVSVSPAEVTAYYEAHRSEFIQPEAVQAATIFIRPRDNLDVSRAYAQAQEIYRQLQQGADFYELARRHSDGFNAQMGGRIGMLEKGRNLKEVDEVLFDLKVGQVSPIIKTPAGFHLFRIEAARPAAQAPLSQVQSQIEARLREEKAAARFDEWIAKLRSESYIAIKQ